MPESDSLEITREEKQLLDDRWVEFLAAPESAFSVEEFKGKLKQLRA